MKLLYAGGSSEPAQQQMVVGQVKLSQPELTHQIVDYIGDNLGYGTVLAILAIGSAVVLRKKITKFLLGEGKSDGK